MEYFEFIYVLFFFAGQDHERAPAATSKEEKEKDVAYTINCNSRHKNTEY